MKIPYPAVVVLPLLLLSTSCSNFEHAGRPLSPAENRAAKFSVEGLKLGDGLEKIARFPEVVERPARVRGYDAVYEINAPVPQISTIVAFLREGRIVRMELRYFDGRNADTLTRAGGWTGIRDYILDNFGAPTRIGANVPLQTLQPGLNPRYAKFNGVWNFPTVNRQLNYVAMAGKGQGVGVVTMQDVTPLPTPPPPPAPNRGARTTTRPAATNLPAETAAPTPRATPPAQPAPGF